jgi:hypothetical protein
VNIQKTADSLPEIQPQYSDALWTVADHKTTINPAPPNTTVVLYAGDYGFHTGNILWRGHFNATGAEKGFAAELQGGSAFGFSVWLDTTFLGSWNGINGLLSRRRVLNNSFLGDGVTSVFNQSFPFTTALRKGSTHVLTILQGPLYLHVN